MTSPSAAEVRGSVPVVKLEWHEFERGTSFYALTIVGQYSAWDFDGKDGHWRAPESFAGRRVEGDVDAAKAAAQTDYEQRILSAVNPDYASALDTARAEIERLRQMLTAAEKHGSVYAAVERVLDERGAWVARPNHETTMRVALAATITANELLGDPVGKVADAQCAVTNAEMARDDEQERADRAESALTAAQERIAELEGALSKIDHEYETEYAGRSYTRCTCCHVALSDGHPHLADCAWATLSPAVKEPTNA